MPTLSEREASDLLAAAGEAPDAEARRDVLSGRSARFLEWVQHHPRLGVVAAEAWSERRGVCAKPREAALWILEAVLEEPELL